MHIHLMSPSRRNHGPPIPQPLIDTHQQPQLWSKLKPTNGISLYTKRNSPLICAPCKVYKYQRHNTQVTSQFRMTTQRGLANHKHCLRVIVKQQPTDK